MNFLQGVKEDQPEYIALDTETTGLQFHDTAFVLTCAYVKDGHVKSAFFDLERSDGRTEAEQLLQTSFVPVFHNAKFDIQKLQMASLLRENECRFEDTEALSHLLNEHRPKRLKSLAKELLGIEPLEETELKKVCRTLKIKKSDGYHEVPREVLEPYAVKDAEYTILIFNRMYPLLRRQRDLFDLYQREKELTWALLDIEAKGLRIDRAYVDRTLREYLTEQFRLELNVRDLAGTETFNPRSNNQIRAYFEEKGIHRAKYDKANLMEVEDPMGKALLSLRRVSKLCSTYLRALDVESKIDNILHPNFRQHKPVTGRMSSGKEEQ